jgi:hypothetical protein
MRRLGVVAAVMCAAVVGWALLVPAPTHACAGCPMPLREAISGADYGVVAVVEHAGADGSRELRVTTVLLGSPRVHLAFGPNPKALDLPEGTRWILFGVSRHGLDRAWTLAWQVLSGGRLVPPPGPPLDAPTTLKAFIRQFAAPATDTVTPQTRHPDGPTGLALLAVITGVGTWATLRTIRMRPARRGSGRGRG